MINSKNIINIYFIMFVLVGDISQGKDIYEVKYNE